MPPDGAGWGNIALPRQFQCGFISELNHWRGAGSHRGTRSPSWVRWLERLRQSVPNPPWAGLLFPSPVLSETVSSLCSSSLQPPLSNFHFQKEGSPLTHLESYDGSLPGAKKIHRETKQADLTEITVPAGQPLRGTQRGALGKKYRNGSGLFHVRLRVHTANHTFTRSTNVLYLLLACLFLKGF